MSSAYLGSGIRSLSPALFLASFLLLFTLSQAAQLVIYEAGKNGKKGPVLSNDAKFCPSSFSSKGFSVLCEPSGSASMATFYVDDSFARKEGVAPYAIAGDTSGDLASWTSYSMNKNTKIACVISDSEKVSVTVRFTCDDSPATPVVENSPKPSPTSTPTATSTVYKTISKGNCVVIPATSYVGDLTDGWTKGAKNVSFEINNNWTGVYGPDKAKLKYEFKVPVEASYGVTLDMTTEHITEHNDVFLTFPHGKGFMLRKGNPSSTRVGGTGPLKAYHNRVGRATQAFSVDHDPHTFYTADVLKPGTTYSIILGARSTKVTIHNIILFPCQGENCGANSSWWNTYVYTCK